MNLWPRLQHQGAKPSSGIETFMLRRYSKNCRMATPSSKVRRCLLYWSNQADAVLSFIPLGAGECDKIHWLPGPEILSCQLWRLWSWILWSGSFGAEPVTRAPNNRICHIRHCVPAYFVQKFAWAKLGLSISRCLTDALPVPYRCPTDALRDALQVFPRFCAYPVGVTREGGKN